MKNWWLFIAILLTGCVSKLPLESSNELIGCWKAEKVEIFNADGTSRVQPASTLCMISFTSEKLTTTCTSPQSTNSTGYAYRVVRPGVYVAKIVSNANPQILGNENEYQYRIDNDHLFIIAHPQTAKPSPISPAIRTESDNSRTTCSGIQQPYS